MFQLRTRKTNYPIEVVAIVAMTPDNVIGDGNQIPWRMTKVLRERYFEDINLFKDFTVGHPVIMGRKSYVSIPEKFRPLSERANVVVTSNSSFRDGDSNIVLAHSIEEALEKSARLILKEVRVDGVRMNGPIFVAGGAEIYHAFMSDRSNHYLDRLLVSELHEHFFGNYHFPNIGVNWVQSSRVDRGSFDFVEYVRAS